NAQLLGCAAGGGGVGGGEDELDVRAEQAPPGHRALRLPERRAYHGVGGVGSTLPEPQQGETRLGVVAVLAGPLVGGFGAQEVAGEAGEGTLESAGGAPPPRASSSASGHDPSRPSTSARCRKQWPR